jgi:hypothetical protein
MPLCDQAEYLRAIGSRPSLIPNPRDRQISDLAKQALSLAMIVDVGVGPAENHLPDEIIGQEIMREAEFDFGGLVQLGQLFVRQLPVKRFQVVLNLRGAASSDNRNDDIFALAQPVKCDLRGGATDFVRQLRYNFSDSQLALIRRIIFAAEATGFGICLRSLDILAAENATGQR